MVEIDDYGDLWDRRQLDQAVELLKSLNSRQVFFVTYIHGWRHNASFNDSNFKTFDEIIQNLRTTELCRAMNEGHNNDCAVYGLYLSWRGKPIEFAPLDYLSFYNRYSASRRSSEIESSNVISILTAQLAAQDRVRLNTHLLNDKITSPARLEAISKKSSKSLLIGHSFGARFLENAIAQSTLGRMEALTRSDLPARLKELSRAIEVADRNINSYRVQIKESFERTKLISDQLKSSRTAVNEARVASERAGDPKIARQNLLDHFAAYPTTNAIESVSSTLSTVGKQGSERDDFRRLTLISEKSEHCAAAEEDKNAGRVTIEATNSISILRKISKIATSSSAYNPDAALCGSSEEDALITTGKEFVDFATSLEKKRASLGHLFDILIATSSSSSDCYELRQLLAESLARESGATNGAAEIFGTISETAEQISKWSSDYIRKKDAMCSTTKLKNAEIAFERLAAQNSLLSELQRINQSQAERAISEYRDQVVDFYSSATSLMFDAVEALRPQADVILMINPATEGIRGRQLATALAPWKARQRNIVGKGFLARPSLIQLAGRNDSDTAKKFVTAVKVRRFFGLSPAASNDIPGARIDDRGSAPQFGAQHDLLVTPLPQLASAITHCERPKDTNGYSFGARPSSLDFTRALISSFENPESSPVDVFVSPPAGDSISVADIEKRCSKEPAVDTVEPDTRPLWVLSVGEKIIANHNDIFTAGTGYIIGEMLGRSSMANFSCRAITEEVDPTVCRVMTELKSLSSSLQKLSNIRNDT